MKAKVHEFPGWEHGPADATHFSTQRVWFPWLKLEDGRLYYSDGYPEVGWEWDEYNEDEAEIHPHFQGAIAKHVVEELPALPYGHKWEDAPEGTTHFHCQGDENSCWWIKLREDGLAHYCKIKAPRMGEFTARAVIIEALENPRYQTIPKHAGVLPVKVKAEPAPKKRVGWWS